MFSIVFFFMLAVVASAAISVFLRQKALGTLAGLVIFIGFSGRAPSPAPVVHRSPRRSRGVPFPTACRARIPRHREPENLRHADAQRSIWPRLRSWRHRACFSQDRARQEAKRTNLESRKTGIKRVLDPSS